MATPKLYIFLGSAGSGRRAIIADLIANGLNEEAKPFLLISGNESDPPAEVSAALAEIEGLAIAQWTRDEKGGLAIAVPDGVTDVFLLTDGGGDPVDQVEAVHKWLPASGVELGRILTIVNCRLGSEQPGVLRWYNACIHFSDVVLLSQRDGVPNKWISDFTGRLRKEHFPCLVDMVKKNGVPNPSLLLEPQARRMSLLFDEPDEWPDLDDEAKAGAATGDDEDLIGREDPYIERMVSGRRVRDVPDITRFLDGE